MYTVDEVKKINHFYYCLQISILFSKKYDGIYSSPDLNLVVLKWLKVSRDKKIFNKVVHNEIRWLRKTITKNPLRTDIYQMISKIAETSTIISNELSRCKVEEK